MIVGRSRAVVRATRASDLSFLPQNRRMSFDVWKPRLSMQIFEVFA